jgi:glucose-1-phosphate thymidylyltransferase
MIAGIRSILIISTPDDTPRFQELLGDGSQLGISLSYAVQESPRGLADAFIVGKHFIGNDSVCLILGDNLFFGHDLTDLLSQAVRLESGALIIGYSVSDPRQYGVLEFDRDGKVLSVEEKPEKPRSNYAIVGLYFYDNTVVMRAEHLRPSARGELEITDLNRDYLASGQLTAKLMGRGYAWLDAGTPHSLVDASNFVRTIEERQGLKIACIEEIAYRKGFISQESLLAMAAEIRSSLYGQYLKRVASEQE